MLDLGFHLERTPVTERAFLSTLGLPDLSDEVLTEILSRHSLRSLLDADEETLASMAGVDAVAADRFLRALKKNVPFFEKLKSRGIELVPEATSGTGTAKSPIAGKAVVFTGKMVRGSREEMQETARRLGAKVQTAVAQLPGLWGEGRCEENGKGPGRRCRHPLGSGVLRPGRRHREELKNRV